MSTFTVTFDVPRRSADEAVEALSQAGFASSIGSPRPDTDGVLVVIECWFDHQREIRPAIDRAASVLTRAGIIASNIRSLPSHDTRRRILRDGELVPDVYVFGTNEDEWSQHLDVIAADQGIDRTRLTLDPEDDPFRELLDGE